VTLSLIIPAYNEEQRFGPQLGQVLEYLRARYPDFELIIVDDGSRDGTADVVRAAIADEPRAKLLSYQPNRGKGYAIRQGVAASIGEAVIFTDADLSTPLDEIPHALEQLKAAPIVIGSRDLPTSDVRVKQSFFRRFASEFFRWARHLMVGLQTIADTQCGFKAYRGPIARQLYEHAFVDRFMFDIEILYLAERAGLKIVEMPVRWTDVAGSKVRFWEGLVNMVRDLWRIRVGHRKTIRIENRGLED
jgi:dolichyl-phosphate beta-glucosyltransferase